MDVAYGVVQFGQAEMMSSDGPDDRRRFEL
jgi:hypothetical protein